MSNQQDKKHPKMLPEETSVASRRKFLTGGLAVAGLAACAGKDGINGLGGPSGAAGVNGADGASGAIGATGASGSSGNSAMPTSWDYTADVVVIGSGAAGLVAALAAQSKGASVLIVEMNYDIGGHAIVSGGTVDLGGGTAPQAALSIVDSADKVFDDLCVPASYNPDPNGSLGASSTKGLMPGIVWGRYGGPFQDRAFCRVYADNNVATEKFLRDNGIVWASTLTTSHWAPKSGTARSHVPTWANNVAGYASPNGSGGAGYARPLEITARNKGIKFLLNYRVNAIHRDAVFSGNVRGVTAAYTGGVIANGAALRPYCEQTGSLVPNTGNINITTPVVNIKANKGVFVATGGATSNVFLRRTYDSRMTDCYSTGGEPYSYQTGDGILLSQKIGAAIYAPGNQTGGSSQLGTGSNYNKAGNIGCFYGYQNLQWNKNSPVFPLAGGSGLRSASMANLIHVNQVGQRFADETAPQYVWCDAAMQPNAGSIGPDYAAGPVWAIFDENARVRQSWDVTTAGAVDPNFFYSAATLSDLVKKINTNKFQVTPMDPAVLTAAIAKYNGFVTAAVDSDFGKPVASLINKIDTGPFYAASSSPVMHDWLTGVRIDAGARVLDLDGKIVPGLYAAGEDVGGMLMHGLAKCAVYGMIGGYNAAAGV